MLPSRENFWQHVKDLGISKDDFIVAYDGMGIFSAARCWWMFRFMGWNEPQIGVLDGGFPRFAERFPEQIDSSAVESLSHEPGEDLSSYFTMNEKLLRTSDDIES